MSGIVNKNAGRGSGTIGTITTDLSGDSSPQLGGFLDANGNYIQMQKGGDISSASPTVIDTDGDFFAVTGTTNFSAFTVAADRHFFLEFGGALTMTHGNGTLDLPGAANITTAASDVGEFISTASNVVTCVNYTKRDGTAIIGGLTNRAVNSMTGDGSDTTLSLSQSPGSVNNINAFVDGVSQIPGTDFTLDGSTLTWTTAPALGTKAVAVSGALSDIGTPSDGTVTLAKMAVNSVDSDQYVDGSIDAAHLSANSIDSDSYVDASIDLAHIATNQIDETLLKDAFVADFTDATVTASDYFLHGDATDSGNTKKDSIQGILDLAGGGLTSKMIGATYDLSTTGDFAVTGVGFVPTCVILFINKDGDPAASWGFTSSTITDDGNVHNFHNSTAERFNTGGTLSDIYTAASNNSTLIVKSYDADGATFTKAKPAGSPTGTGYCKFLFMK